MCHTYICSVGCCYLLFLLFCCIVYVVLYLTDCFVYVPRGLDILLKLKLIGGGKRNKECHSSCKGYIILYFSNFAVCHFYEFMTQWNCFMLFAVPIFVLLHVFSNSLLVRLKLRSQVIFRQRDISLLLIDCSLDKGTNFWERRLRQATSITILFCLGFHMLFAR